MTLYNLVSGVVAFIAVSGFLGLLFRIPIFGGKRRYAFVVFVIAVGVGPMLSGLKSDRDHKDDKAAEAVNNQAHAADAAKGQLATDAKIVIVRGTDFGNGGIGGKLAHR